MFYGPLIRELSYNIFIYSKPSLNQKYSILKTQYFPFKVLSKIFVR